MARGSIDADGLKPGLDDNGKDKRNDYERGHPSRPHRDKPDKCFT
jgi:hypothetical protein